MPEYTQTEHPVASAANHSQSLANLIEKINAKLDEGSEIDLEKIVAEHPEHEQKLRELVPAMIAMANWGKVPTENSNGEQQGTNDSHLTGVLGDFRILSELGRGGMGTVYEAEQISMGRRVALKVLPFAALAHGRALQRFRNEVRAAAALDDPHIVSVYSVGDERGVHYYSMQLIHGQSLAELIDQTRSELLDSRTTSSPVGISHKSKGNEKPTVESGVAPLAETTMEEQALISTAINSVRDAQRYRKAAQLGIQAAEALQHAHDQGVLHRDIKPGNLMIDRDGELHVTDFGLARIGADAGMTMTGDIVGTLRYMAPEQALAKRVVIDHRADIYSLGATLYELLALRPAFIETDRSELLKRIAFDEPTPLRKLDRHMPAELETIVQTAMAKAPGDRYATAQELADDLTRYLDNEPIRAKQPTVLERFVKWSQRHAAAVWAIAVTLLITTVALAASRLMVGRANSDLAGALEREQAAAEVARAAEQRSGDLLYAADVRLAGEAIAHLNVNEARERLTRHIPTPGQPDRRGFAWHRLWSQIHQAELTLTGHGPAYDVDYSPDGLLLASAHQSGEVVLYDAESGRELHSFTGLDQIARKLKFSPDGMLLAALSDDGTVRVWRVADRSLLVQFSAHQPGVGDLAFHPDGRQLAIVAHQTARLFRIDLDGVGETLVENIATFGPLKATLHAVDVSAEGQVIAIGGIKEGERNENGSGIVWLWDINSHKEIDRLDMPTKVTALAFAEKRPMLAIGFDNGQVSVRDLNARRVVSKGRPQNGRIYEIGFAAEDRLLFVSSKDSTGAIWDIQRKRMYLRLIGHAQRVYGTAVSPLNGHYATASSDGAVKTWLPRAVSQSRQVISANRLRKRSDAQFSSDGQLLMEVYAGGDAFRYDLSSDTLSRWHVDWLGTGQPRVGWQHAGNRLFVTGMGRGEPQKSKQETSSAAPASTTLATEMCTAIYDADSYDLVHRLPVGAGRAALSPDGKHLAVIENEEEIHVWDLHKGRHVLTIPYAGVRILDVTYSPDGRFLLAAVGDNLRVWDAATHELLYDFIDHDDSIHQVAVSADSRLAATVSNDMSVRLWSLAEGRHLPALMGHTSRPIVIAISNDGRRVASGAKDGKIRLWDTKTGGQLLSIGTLTEFRSDIDELIRDLAFSDDRSLAAIVRIANPGSTVLYQWRVTRGEGKR